MYNFYVIEIQTNPDGTSGVVSYGFVDKGDCEDKYLEVRMAARQSSVLIHTVMFIDNRGNVFEKKAYVHPATQNGENQAQ